MKKKKMLVIALSIFALSAFVANASADSSYVPNNSYYYFGGPSVTASANQSQDNWGNSFTGNHFGEASLYQDQWQSSWGDTFGNSSTSAVLQQEQSQEYGSAHASTYNFTANQVQSFQSSFLKTKAKSTGLYGLADVSGDTSQNSWNENYTTGNPWNANSATDSGFNQYLNSFAIGDASASAKLKNSGTNSYLQAHTNSGNIFSSQYGASTYKAALSGSTNSWGNLVGDQSSSTQTSQDHWGQSATMIANSELGVMGSAVNYKASQGQTSGYMQASDSGYQSGSLATTMRMSGSLPVSP